MKRLSCWAQVVLAPHIYCGDVSGTTGGTTGPSLWNRLTETFGYLTSSGAPCGWLFAFLAVLQQVLPPFPQLAQCMLSCLLQADSHSLHQG